MSEMQMPACEIEDAKVSAVSFEQAEQSFASRKFWISFFVRPCCPPPAGTQAKMQLDKQRELVMQRTDFTPEQQKRLLELIDEGEAWYRSTPYWRKGSEQDN